MLELKLRKIGNSVSIVLPKEALIFLQAGDGDTITATECCERTGARKPDEAGSFAPLTYLSGRILHQIAPVFPFFWGP